MNESNAGRKRYQRGSLILKGNQQKVWYLRWLEDVIENGVLRRMHRSTRIGSLEQFPTRTEAQKEADRIVSEVNDSEYRARTILTFKEMAEMWQNKVMVLHKPASQASEKGHISYHLIPYFGSMQLTAIRTETVQGFVSTCKLAPKSVRNVMDTFRLIWKSAKAWGYVKHNPLENVTLPRLLADTQRVYSGSPQSLSPARLSNESQPASVRQSAREATRQQQRGQIRAKTSHGSLGISSSRIARSPAWECHGTRSHGNTDGCANGAG